MTMVRVLIAACLAVTVELIAAGLLAFIGLPSSGWINLMIFISALVIALHVLQVQGEHD